MLLSAGHLLFNLSGHQDVVRDLSFTPNGNLILVSASRDKTLRVWDLSRDGMSELMTPPQWGVDDCSDSPGSVSMLVLQCCSYLDGDLALPLGYWDPKYLDPKPVETQRR